MKANLMQQKMSDDLFARDPDSQLAKEYFALRLEEELNSYKDERNVAMKARLDDKVLDFTAHEENPNLPPDVDPPVVVLDAQESQDLSTQEQHIVQTHLGS
eukprot:TRINITY_DN60117_c0_g2_i1.p1 TRINITY_DN60117_c0_g2~~TRINITY_DN60117_c0_g2_i1.p1  ORF type:complete len:101 (-),score=35.57 TRINITY_DN60117_c0_g2_i1:39-341(-)